MGSLSLLLIVAVFCKEVEKFNATGWVECDKGIFIGGCSAEGKFPDRKFVVRWFELIENKSFEDNKLNGSWV